MTDAYTDMHRRKMERKEKQKMTNERPFGEFICTNCGKNLFNILLMTPNTMKAVCQCGEEHRIILRRG
jgi:ribosomal protein L34E